MHRLLKRILPLAGLLLCAVPSEAQWTKIQSPTPNTTLATKTVTSTGAGHLLIVMVNGASGGATTHNTPTTTGTAQTWVTLCSQCQDGSHGVNAGIFYTCNSAAGTTGINATDSASDANIAITFLEYSGNATSSCHDKGTTLQDAGSSSNWTSASITPTAGALVTVFGYQGTTGGTTYTATASGYAIESQANFASLGGALFFADNSTASGATSGAGAIGTTSAYQYTNIDSWLAGAAGAAASKIAGPSTVAGPTKTD